ncbi:MAG TPA: hypothetical protein VFV46_00035 [Lacibacter sp.]|nr:hypothetical protein [Lacibacter sp.]
MKTLVGILLASLLLSSGCTTSRITSSWKAKGEITPVFQKILVLGLLHENNHALQQRMETHLADDLKMLGYKTITSLDEYGPKAFEHMSEKEALEKLKYSGIDGVLTIVLLDKAKEQYYVPGRIHYSPYGFYYDRFWGYRGVLYQRIYEPGYYVTDTQYFWESNLYMVQTQQLVYSVQTESFDPVNTQNQAHEYGKLIIKNMLTNGIIKQN